MAELMLWSPAEYHADETSLSHSALDVFLEDPSLYHGQYITKQWPREETESLQFGSLFHEHFLFGRKLEELVCSIPATALTSNGQRRGNAWEDFQTECGLAGITPMLDSDLEKLKAMVEGIWRHPMARWIFEQPGAIEAPIRWTDRRAIQRRSLLDKFMQDRLIVDLKTCASVQEDKFAKAALEFGYHRQAGYYREAAFALTGEWLPFVFVCSQKSPPYTCEVYEVAGEFLELGDSENAYDLDRWAECMEKWRETQDPTVWVRPGSDEIRELKLPGWAKRRLA